MIKQKLVAILTIGVSLLIAGSSLAYYHYALPKKDKNVVVSLKVIPTPTTIPTPTSSPSATPAPLIKYIHYPTATPTPDIKQVLNDYAACKQACPIVGEGSTCTTSDNPTSIPPTPVCHPVEGGTGQSCVYNSGNSNSTTTCHSNSHPDQACIDSCKSKYGLNF